MGESRERRAEAFLKKCHPASAGTTMIPGITQEFILSSLCSFAKSEAKIAIARDRARIIKVVQKALENG